MERRRGSGENNNQVTEHGKEREKIKEKRTETENNLDSKSIYIETSRCPETEKTICLRMLIYLKQKARKVTN